MLWTIARFEARCRLRRPSTHVYFLAFFAIALLWMAAAGGAFQSANLVFDSEKVFINSPYAIAQTVAVLGMFGVIVIGAVAGRAVQQDFEHGAFHFFFTAPIRRRAYLGGRFLGALLTLLYIFSSVAIGGWIGAHLPWVQKAAVGPERLAGYLLPYLTTFLPNALLIGAAAFGLAALTRRMLPVYLLTVVFLMGYLAALTLIGDLERKPLAALLDPFGTIAMGRVTEYWSISEKNDRLVPLTGLFLWNRLVWLAVSTGLAAFCYSRFRFQQPGPGRTRALADADAAPAAPPLSVRPVVPVTPPRGWSALRLLPGLVRLQLRETVKNVYFTAIVVAGVLFMVLTSASFSPLFGTQTYPVTYLVLEQVSGSFSLFVLIVITFYSGELLWREQEARLDQIHDALPVPSWVILLGKLLTLCLLPGLLLGVVLITGLGVQLFKGYFQFELGLYGYWLFLVQWPRYVLVCLLAFSLQVIIRQKYLGYFAMVLYYIVSIALVPLGFEHPLYRPLASPQVVYSAMNGFGHFLPRLRWLQLYWLEWMLVLLGVAALFWVRGTGIGFRERARGAGRRLGGAARAAIAVGAVAIAATGGFIFYNTNVLNRYQTEHDVQAIQAGYEKHYKSLAATPQPRVVGVRLEVDLYPDQRRVHARGELELLNRDPRPVAEVHLTLSRDRERRWERLDLAVPAKVTRDDEALGLRTLRLDQPLAPGARTTLRFEEDWAPRGFPTGATTTQLVANGSFVDSMALLPTVGYDERRELERDKERRRFDLSPKERMRPRGDPAGLARNYITPDADFITYETTVSTSPDQIAISPGYLQREWTSGGRRYFHYKMDSPILDFYSFQSARYQVRRDRWVGSDGAAAAAGRQEVAIEIYYHPGHEYNLDRMIEATKAGLDYFTKQFGPYQHRQFRILEFPRYQSFAQSFPNTIPYSESVGFIAKVDPTSDKDIDYPYYVTAHELAHQWWAHQVVPANVQGATLLSESLAQYSALMLMKRRYGEHKMRRFLRYELDRYLIGRATEAKKEVPLARVEDQGYIHYNKGSLVMYALQDYIGEERLNRAIRAFRDEVAYHGPPYPESTTLLRHLRAATPPELHGLLDDLFESIILFENRAVAATYREVAPGRYRVKLKLHAQKLKSDELGALQEVPPDHPIEVGVFGKEDKPLYLQKRRLVQGEQALEVEVSEPPRRAGIDPYNKLIDRKPEDNLLDVGRER